MPWSPTGCGWWGSTPCAGSSSPTRPTGRSPARTRFGWAGGPSWSPTRAPATRPATSWSGCPQERVLFAGDILVEDGVTMVVDGSSPELLRRSLARIDSLAPAVVVPGPRGDSRPAGRRWWPGPGPTSPASRPTCGRRSSAACPMQRALATLPPADENRPVSLNFAPAAERGAGLCGGGARATWDWTDSHAVRRRFRDWSRAALLCGVRRARRSRAGARRAAEARLPGMVSTDELAALAGRGARSCCSTSGPTSSPISRATCPARSTSTPRRSGRARAASRPGCSPRGVSRAVLPAGHRLRTSPVVIYSAGETHNIDATFLAWLLAGFGHPQVYVLDGGYFKWQLEQRPVVQQYPRIPVTAFPDRALPPGGGRPGGGAGRASTRRRALLVDARPPDQYAGRGGGADAPTGTSRARSTTTGRTT